MLKYRILFKGLIVLIVAFTYFTVLSEGAEKGVKKEVSMITEGNLVKVHYTLTVNSKVVDRSREKKSLEFQVGSRQMIPGFEKAIKGMKVGEKNISRLPRRRVWTRRPQGGGYRKYQEINYPQDIKPEVGMTLYAKRENGQSIPVRIIEVKKDVVIMNFNYPLAGKTLNFDVEIIQINRGA